MFYNAGSLRKGKRYVFLRQTGECWSSCEVPLSRSLFHGLITLCWCFFEEQLWEVLDIRFWNVITFLETIEWFLTAHCLKTTKVKQTISSHNWSSILMVMRMGPTIPSWPDILETFPGVALNHEAEGTQKHVFYDIKTRLESVLVICELDTN